MLHGSTSGAIDDREEDIEIYETNTSDLDLDRILSIHEIKTAMFAQGNWKSTGNYKLIAEVFKYSLILYRHFTTILQ